MMNLLVVAIVAVTAVLANDHHDYTDASKFADYLKDIRKSHEFSHMDATEQDLYQNLILAAEQGSASLSAFISAQSFTSIIRLIDHLDKDDIPHFEGYLVAHLRQPTATSVVKRQSNSELFGFLRDLHLAHKIEDNLSKQDMRVFLQILYAAEHNTLTQYIDQNGYDTVLDLMSQVEDDQIHGFDRMLIRHLEYEARLSPSTAAPAVSIVSQAATTPAAVVSTAAPVVASTAMGPV